MTNQAAQTMPELPASRGYLSLYHSGGVAQVNGYTADQMHQYARDYAAALSQAAGVPDVLFDGYAVYQGMTDEARARINAGGVSDVLDSVVRLLRAKAAPAASGGESAASLSSNPNPVTPSLSSESAASVSERERIDTLALDVARRFTQDTEPQRRASLQVAVIAAIEQALTQQRWHGTTGSMEQAEKATFVPCDCGCGRSCCAMCGNDVGFLTPQPSADAVRELVKRWRDEANAGYLTGDSLIDCATTNRQSVFFQCANELESLLSGGSHA